LPGIGKVDFIDGMEDMHRTVYCGAALSLFTGVGAEKMLRAILATMRPVALALSVLAVSVLALSGLAVPVLAQTELSPTKDDVPSKQKIYSP